MRCSHPGGDDPCRRELPENSQKFDRKFEISENRKFKISEKIFSKNCFFASVGHIKKCIPERVGVFLER